jgi:Holliday junction resolvase
MVNSKQKGSRRERELASILRDKGYTDARRTQQYCGNTGDASDVVGLPHIHCEVKGTQVTTINKFIKQAKRDSKNKDDIPTVFYKRNNEPWLVVMDIDDWFEFYTAWKKERSG